MTLAELRRSLHDRIDSLDVDLLICSVLGCNRAKLFTRMEEMIPPESEERIRALAKRRTEHEPIAYILGEKEFYGRSFNVSPAVLIPRPETELLVDRALLLPHLPRQVIDIGVGSGAILVSIVCGFRDRYGAEGLRGSRFIGTDLSRDALAISRQNAERHSVSDFIELREGDLFAGVETAGEEVIVSNPPYIAEGESLPPDVERFEPRLALRAGVDGLAVLRPLITAASPRITGGSRMFLEIGAGQIDGVLSLVSSKISAEVHRDYAGIERMVELSAAISKR